MITSQERLSILVCSSQLVFLEDDDVWTESLAGIFFFYPLYMQMRQQKCDVCASTFMHQNEGS